ncbi:MAG TPA: MFS transporter [Oceanicaulis sp.]|jgi:MFS family permease|uniref:ABC transporter permease n=1 Tax=Glycocaulis albus TaxID=1382801 RepID=A0ABQ1XSG6_9PROT|nr:MFS transporter [Glycocaulis albus]MBV5259396.1 MFS transporter [Synechococcus moorigangaii CMS01]GGH01700.1 ABC transporter permease [Glycocaulis albus]HCY55141.1 MFS transporter [Oceanicaulis sp.]
MAISFLISDTHARARSLFVAIMCGGLAGCGFGLLMPLISLNLEAMTGSGAMSGANAAAAALAMILSTPFIPGLFSRIAPRILLAASLAVIAAGILVFPAVRDVWVWFGTRFIIGIAVTIVFIASETWINQLAKPERRASLLAVYATVLSAGFGSGGLLLALLGAEGWAPWIAGAAIYAAGVLPVIFLRGPDLVPPKADEGSPLAILTTARLAPAAILAGFLFGALENSFFALMPVYGERTGLTTTLIGLLMTTGALGALFLQIPIGNFADRAGRMRTLALITLAAVAVPLLIIASSGFGFALFPLIFLYVGLASAYYTVGLSVIGERVKASQLAAANAAFIFAYGSGSLFGPPLGGLAMDWINPHGFLLALSVIAAVYLPMALKSWRG